MSSSKDRTARLLVQKALEFHRLAPWEQFGGEDLFLLEVPGEEHPLLGAVMGAAGEIFGLALYRGPEALVLMMRTIEGEPPEQVTSEQSLLGFTMDRLHEIPKPARRILDQAGFTGRRESSAPMFLCQPTGRRNRSLRTSEVKILLYALSGFLEAWQAGELKPRNLRRSSGLQRTIVSGSPGRPEHRTVETPFPRPPLPDSIQEDLSDLSILDECWLATVTELGPGIKGEEQVLRILLVMERDSGNLLCHHTVLGVGIEEAVDLLVRHFRGENRDKRSGLPRELRFASKSLADPLREPLETAGVRVRYDAELPKLQQLVDTLRESARSGEPPARGPRRPTDPVLARWKAEEYDLVLLMSRAVGERENERYRSLQRYFGDPEFGEELLTDLEDYGIGMAFCEWLAAHHRHSKTSPTLIEHLLEGSLSAEQHELLQARKRARPSLFRVSGTDPDAGTVQLTELFSGEDSTIHDQGLSECLTDDLVMPLALLPAGPFTFALLQGPPIAPMHLERALDWLKSNKLQPNARAFARKPHLLGRLWEWFGETRNAGPPRMTNTDGDPLEWQTASFSLDDPDGVDRALRKRADIAPPVEQEPSTYHWLRPDSKASPALGPSGTLLGKLQVIGDELVLEVNSKGRLERAREWLEQIPGVRFQSVQSKSLQSGPSPLDDRLPGSEPDIPPDEVAVILRQALHQHALRWLDESIPALGGKTPRQAVKTKAGRDQVTLMIRTWPSQEGPDGKKISPPREEMLRELGLG